MATVAMRSDRNVFKRLGGGGCGRSDKVVCKYWLQGRCFHNPCRYLHPTKPNSWTNPIEKQPVKVLKRNFTSDEKEEEIAAVKKVKYEDDKHFSGCGLSLLKRLEDHGHTNAVSGIVCINQFRKLYTTSYDQSLRVWDCDTGFCDSFHHFHHQCRALLLQASWMLSVLPHEIKGFNFMHQCEAFFGGFGGRLVNAIAMSKDNSTLFAGMDDGTIFSWKATSETTFCQEPALLKGHSGSVLSLVVRAQLLYSGSSDHSIRVWNVDSLECTHILRGHTGQVTTLTCCDEYLFSGSSDKTIRVWCAIENGDIQQLYTHHAHNAVLALSGTLDAQQNPMLLCSCTDTGIYIYDLPTFHEKGMIHSKHDIRALETAPDGLFFTGDVQGVVCVWKLSSTG